MCDIRSEVTWCESSSIRPSSPAVLSSFEGEMLVVAGRGLIDLVNSVREVGGLNRDCHQSARRVWLACAAEVSWPR